MSGAVAKVNKPQLRGLLRKQIGINIAVATGLCFIAAVAQKFLYNDVRVQKYADFYKYVLFILIK